MVMDNFKKLAGAVLPQTCMAAAAYADAFSGLL
jgi:hypothetical protein